MPLPDFAAFSAGLAAGQGQVLWRERVADLDTPVGVFLKLAAGKPNSFLLESVEGGAARGRYSAVGMEPDLIWRCRDGRAWCGPGTRRSGVCRRRPWSSQVWPRASS